MGRQKDSTESKGLVAPPGQCAYCDRRRAYGREAMRAFRRNGPKKRRLKPKEDK